MRVAGGLHRGVERARIGVLLGAPAVEHRGEVGAAAEPRREVTTCACSCARPARADCADARSARCRRPRTADPRRPESPRNSGANSPWTVETCTPTFSNTRPRIIAMTPPPPGPPVWSVRTACQGVRIEAVPRSGKARRFDNVRFNAKAGGEAQNRAGVLRDVGFEQGDPHGRIPGPHIDLDQGPEPVRGEGFVRLLVVSASAGLRYPDKGANKRRRIAAFCPSSGSGRPAQPPPRCGIARGLPRGGADRSTRDLRTVTSTSAEPTRRDFLYIATGTVGAIGAAAALIPLSRR
jgi:hypothetical protein